METDEKPKPTSRPALAAVLLACVACGTPEPPPASAVGEWRGTVTIDDGRTTVVNESGSVWGGSATLVEETSIGVAEGEEPYLFGRVNGVWATADRILVVDAQAPAVRVYDRGGTHLFDVGREGQGPGEYSEPWLVAVTGAGEIVVSETGGRLHVYDPEGYVLFSRRTDETWGLYAPNSFVLGHDDVMYKAYVDMDVMDRAGLIRFGYRTVGRDGTTSVPEFPPDAGFEPSCLQFRDATNGQMERLCGIPYMPAGHSALTPAGDWVVGVSDQYAFTIHGADGAQHEVRRAWDPIPVSTPEREYLHERTLARIRARSPGWTWSGPDIPDHKPAYRALVPGRSERIWVLREGPSRRVETPCTDDLTPRNAAGRDHVPCWVAPTFFDAFAADGRFLGELDLPDDVTMVGEPFISGDRFLTAVVDDAGVIRVKAYRIRLPNATVP